LKVDIGIAVRPMDNHLVARFRSATADDVSAASCELALVSTSEALAMFTPTVKGRTKMAPLSVKAAIIVAEATLESPSRRKIAKLGTPEPDTRDHG
jgi:hypothetical protein